MRRRIRVRTDQARRLRVKLHLLFEDAQGNLIHQEARWEGSDEFSYEQRHGLRPVGAVADPYEPGYWSTWDKDFDTTDTIWCAAIEEGGYQWWHSVLGRTVDDPERGKGIKIGVIDAGFEPGDDLPQMHVLESGGGVVDEDPGRWIHGELICRILGDRAAPEACAPIAPGAELLFASATYDEMTLQDTKFGFPVAGLGDYERLDPVLVTNAIYDLVLEHDIDVINISAGALEIPAELEESLAEAIETAAEQGVVVVCAAGNEFNEVADFPARHPQAVGVAALGCLNWGPPGSVVRDYNLPSSAGRGVWRGHTVFHWCDSAYGQGVDTIGPGIGILVARDGIPAYDLSGTSFAAPIIAGVLAVALSGDQTYLGMPPDQARHSYILDRLRAICSPTGLPRAFEGAGIAALD